MDHVDIETPWGTATTRTGKAFKPEDAVAFSGMSLTTTLGKVAVLFELPVEADGALHEMMVMTMLSLPYTPTPGQPDATARIGGGRSSLRHGDEILGWTAKAVLHPRLVEFPEDAALRVTIHDVRMKETEAYPRERDQVEALVRRVVAEAYEQDPRFVARLFSHSLDAVREGYRNGLEGARQAIQVMESQLQEMDAAKLFYEEHLEESASFAP